METMQDHGWMPRGSVLASPDDKRISVDRNAYLYYRGADTKIKYTDANYAELLRFEGDQEIQLKWCLRKRALLRFASEAVQIAAVQKNGFAIQRIETR
jgi:hypothetical protein